MQQPISIFWFRRDLRLHDNTALYHALMANNPVLPVFIFDTDILNSLSDKTDRRVNFIHHSLTLLQQQLTRYGSTLHVLGGSPLECFTSLVETYAISAVYANHDYEPYAKKRDTAIAQMLKAKDVAFLTFKDQVVFEKSEVVKNNNEPYTVFTPYSRRWKERLKEFGLPSFPSENVLYRLVNHDPLLIPSLQDIGFNITDLIIPVSTPDSEILHNYQSIRDYPAVNGTTRLSVHLRFGTISIRHLVAQALELNETFLNELIWREFYMMILWHFPYVVNGSFKKEYDSIVWRNNENELERWKAGMTGYPIVDAGMRQLNTTGFMHNRVRMITASFLTKHLLIDWRLGEAYFAEKLLDFDLAANNGGWQWAAGCGCDAVPYFRIFNPYLQTEKFDPDLKYIRTWVPELDSFDYPSPIVQHEVARARCLDAYKKALNR